MSVERNTEIGYRFGDLFNEHDVNIADEIFAPNYKSSISQAPTLDIPGWKAYVQALLDGFPDLRQDIEDMIVTDDHLVLQIMYHGTHTGEWLGVPPTGRSVTFRAIGVNRIENGMIVDNYVVVDAFGIFQQMGIIHVPGQSG